MFNALIVSLINSIDEHYATEELQSLLATIDFAVAGTITQAGKKDPRYVIGSGKLAQVKYFIEQNPVDLVVFNNSLTGRQIANIEEVLQVDVVDRGFIILQIFCQNAKTRESQLEVELAQKKYMLPRLGGTKMYSNLSRQGGGFNAKGPGESKLETDRRKIESDIITIKRKLASIYERRAVNSKRRTNANIPIISIIGYTNAGKSSLFNNLTQILGGKNMVLVKDALFSTLGTKYSLLSIRNKNFILVDSVGFISDIPHELLSSFYSTLQSVCEASLIVHVEDGSVDEEELIFRHATANFILEQLETNNTPIINVYTRKDLINTKIDDNILLISNTTKDGIDELIEMIYLKLTIDENIYQIKVPLSDYKNYSYIKTNLRIISENKNDQEYLLRLSLTSESYQSLLKRLNES
ncbi:MAG: GTPase HflX [Acholeplasmatales bacterium]|nr:GTPase HflX [Acholeplasmatales bacterium]